MADLTTYDQVDAELAATASFRANASVAEARRRIAALTRKLDFAEQSDKNGELIRFNHQIVAAQLEAAIQFVEDNATPTDADRLNNPDVVHYDQTGFHNYGGY